MKLRLKKTAQGISFTVRSTGHEELIYAEAESVRMGASQALLSLTYSQNKKGYEFQYLMGPARRIDEVLLQPLPREYLEAILVSFLTLAKDCDSHNLSIQRILFQPEYLFFDPGRYSLVFAYIPMRPITENMGSALDALVFLAEHIQPFDAAAQKLLRTVYDFAKRSAFFSWIEYERFLQEQGVLEKKREQHHPTIRKKETETIDCRESFGFDFVKEALASCQEEAAGCSATEKSETLGTNGPFCYSLLEVSSGKSWPLRQGENEAGALPSAAIALANRVGVSRHHALFQLEGDGVSVMDLHSTNGVYVNGNRVAENMRVLLRPGDVIHLAREQFILQQL